MLTLNGLANSDADNDSNVTIGVRCWRRRVPDGLDTLRRQEYTTIRVKLYVGFYCHEQENETVTRQF